MENEIFTHFEENTSTKKHLLSKNSRIIKMERLAAITIEDVRVKLSWLYPIFDD